MPFLFSLLLHVMGWNVYVNVPLAIVVVRLPQISRQQLWKLIVVLWLIDVWTMPFGHAVTIFYLLALVILIISKSIKLSFRARLVMLIVMEVGYVVAQSVELLGDRQYLLVLARLMTASVLVGVAALSLRIVGRSWGHDVQAS